MEAVVRLVPSKGQLLADAGCSSRRVHRHFAVVQDDVPTGRFGDGSSDSRPSQVGQLRVFTTGRFRHLHVDADRKLTHLQR